MIRNLYTSKPNTIALGPIIKCKRVVFINIGVSEIESNDSEFRFECYTETVRLSELTIESLLEALSQEFLLLLNEDEAVAIMQAIGKYNDIDSWESLRLAQINAYDTSSSVNQITIAGVDGWYSKSDRVGLVNMYQNFANKRAVIDLPLLWLSGQAITLSSAEQALQILSDIEVYSYQCYNITQRHIVGVQNMAKLGSLEALQTFDYKEHYPEKLNIEI